MKVVIPGGTGQIGAVLGRSLRAAGHEVVVLTRRQAWRDRECRPLQTTLVRHRPDVP